MLDALRGIPGFVLLPVLAVLMGSIAVLMLPLGARTCSYLQHGAAGFVFVVASGAVLPTIVTSARRWR